MRYPTSRKMWEPSNMLTRSAYNRQRLAFRSNQIILESRCRLQEACAICLSSVSGCEVYHMPCRHVFHKECYERQLSSMRENRELCAVCRNDLEDCIEEHPILSLIPEPPSPHPDSVEIDELTLFILSSLNEEPSYLLRIQEASDTESTQQEDRWWLDDDDDDDDMNDIDSVS